MARGLSQPVGHILAKNRGILEITRERIAESTKLCSTSRDLIRRIAHLQEYVHENVLTSRELGRGSQDTAINGAARRSEQPEQERQELSQAMAASSLPKSSRDTRKAGLGFLQAEISAGLTFAAITESKNGLEAARNRAHARAAYDAVVRFADRVSLTEEQRKEVLVPLNKLKQRLQALGEQF